MIILVPLVIILITRMIFRMIAVGAQKKNEKVPKICIITVASKDPGRKKSFRTYYVLHASSSQYHPKALWVKLENIHHPNMARVLSK